jgi:Rieske 2Fe-2S family protein
MAPAPIDERKLAACLAPFPAEARILPGEAYTSPEVFAWERAHFFEEGWVCVGRADELVKPGDQRALRVGNEGVLLVRDRNDRLNAFSNVCRHRGHELLVCDVDPINRGFVRCPYHRWTYDLDGSFKGGPGLAGQEGFDPNDPDHSLARVGADIWGGWIFVNVSGDALPLTEHIGDLDGLARPYEPERLFTAASHRYEVRANWKLIVENYHECYHCSEIHPDLCKISPPHSGDDFEPSGVVIGGSMRLVDEAVTMSFDGHSDGIRMRGLDDAGARHVHYVGVFPSVLLSFHPDYVMAHRFEPVAHDRTMIECSWLFPPEARAIAGFDPSYAVDFWDLTNRQDWAAVGSVQRGVGGRGFRQSPFSSRERCVHQVMSMVAAGYLRGRVRPFPPQDRSAIPTGSGETTGFR